MGGREGERTMTPGLVFFSPSTTPPLSILSRGPLATQRGEGVNYIKKYNGGGAFKKGGEEVVCVCVCGGVIFSFLTATLMT